MIHTLLTTLLLAQLLFAPASCGAARTRPSLALSGGTDQASQPEPAAEADETQTITGKVVSIADGDTITVLDSDNRQYRVRLKGIDAPESSQDYGQASRQNLSGMIFRKTVEVTYSKLDRYGRILGVVRLDRLEVNLAQVAAGYAWFYREYQNEMTREERIAYAAAEERAKRERKGLWQQPNPVKPSEYRHGRN
jgi:endonuclease YncB( thermonuclease family)